MPYPHGHCTLSGPKDLSHIKVKTPKVSCESIGSPLPSAMPSPQAQGSTASNVFWQAGFQVLTPKKEKKPYVEAKDSGFLCVCSSLKRNYTLIYLIQVSMSTTTEKIKKQFTVVFGWCISFAQFHPSTDESEEMQTLLQNFTCTFLGYELMLCSSGWWC